MRVTRGIAVLSLTAVATLGLSACSSGGGETDQPAVASTIEPEQASPFDLSKADFVARTAAASRAASSVSMAMTVVAASETTKASGDVRYTDTGADMQLALAVPGVGELDMRVLDGSIYVSVGEQTEGNFIALGPDDTDSPFAALIDQVLDQFDPTASLEGMEGAILSLEKAGEPEEIDGVLAQPYEIVVDMSATTKVMPGGLTDAEDVPDTVTYTYWVGEDDLMRRAVAEIPGGSVDVTFTNWGGEMNITAPAPDLVVDYAGLGM